MSSLLPPEFIDQIEDARFVEEASTIAAADARFIEDGEFFNIIGFAFGPTEFEASAYSATPVIDTKFVDGLIGAHVDASIQREVCESWLFSSAAS